MSFVENLLKPQWYQQQGNKFVASMASYYRPLFRSGSVTPLWHGMFAVGIIMYTASQVGLRQRTIQAKRKIEKKAMEEYVEKHGDPFAHH